MTRQSQKQAERRQLNWILNKFPDWVPDADQIEIGDPEKSQPDFLVLRRNRSKLGIEHTVLKQKTKISGYEPVEIEAARKKICEMARAIYLRFDAPPICVNATIGGGPYLCPEKIAEYFANQVASNFNAGRMMSFWPSMGSPVELHFSAWEPGDAEPDWTLEGVGETQLLSMAMLQEVISNKSKKADGYRKGCDEIWLLGAWAAEAQSSY